MTCYKNRAKFTFKLTAITDGLSAGFEITNPAPAGFEKIKSGATLVHMSAFGSLLMILILFSASVCCFLITAMHLIF